MAIFGFGKKKEDKGTQCSCGCDAKPQQTGPEADSGIKVLGGGCAKCNALEQAVRDAMAELGMDDAIEHVTDFAQIAVYGVMSTPALVVDGKVVSYGRVLGKAEAAELLKKVRA